MCDFLSILKKGQIVNFFSENYYDVLCTICIAENSLLYLAALTAYVCVCVCYRDREEYI